MMKQKTRKRFYEVMPGIFINVTPYDFLINMKLKARRDKDLWDVARLDELKNQKEIIMDFFNILMTTLENNIFTITINRPEKLNALNQTVLDELE